MVRCFASIIVFWMVAAAAQAAPPIAEIRHVLSRYLVAEPTAAQLESIVQANLDEHLRAIDPYARWFSTDPFLAQQGAETTTGIGASIALWSGRYVLVPYKDGPLARAGYQEPAYLEAVDGRDVNQLDFKAVGRSLAGGDGTSVRLELSGPNLGKSEKVTVRRGSYRVRNVERYSEQNVTIIGVRTFERRETRTLLAVAIHEAMSDRRPYVIDLRDSPGGDLFEAFDAAALFVPEGRELASTWDRTNGRKRYKSTGGEKFFPSRIDLWVGPGTASAAEVFAGILQQRGVARLVGRQTRGKCSSQTDVTLSDASVLRLTNREVLFTDGTTCTGSGLRPDVVVDEEHLMEKSILLQKFRDEYSF